MHTFLECKVEEVKEEFLDLLDLLFETMDEIWRSRVPAATIQDGYLLDPLKVMSMFVHLAKFFEATDKSLHGEACLVIIRMPTFLYLVANVMAKQIEGKIYHNNMALYFYSLITAVIYILLHVYTLQPRLLKWIRSKTCCAF